MKRKAPIRRRNATATRAAILLSARKAFADSGYDGAGVREIARGAGVTAMLVNRYFGSKEGLFAEVVADIMAEPTILTPEILGSSNRNAKIAAALVGITQSGGAPLNGFQIMLRSASSRRAAEIMRGQIEQHYQKTLAATLRGEMTEPRAGLLFSLVAGFQVMRQIIGLSSLSATKPEALVRLLVPLVKLLMEDSEPGIRQYGNDQPELPLL